MSVLSNLLLFTPGHSGFSSYVRRVMPAIPGHRLLIDGSHGPVCRLGDGLPEHFPTSGALSLLQRLSLSQHGIRLAPMLAEAGLSMADLSVIYSPYCDALFAARGVPQVITCHDLIPLHCPNSRKAALRYRHWIPKHLSRADKVIAISRFVADQLLETGIPAQKIRIVENGIEPRGKPMLGPSGNRILMLARHDANKNVVLALRGFSKFLAMHPEWDGDLTIVGRDGRQTVSLLAELSERDLQDRVKLLPGVAAEQLERMLKSSFALVSTSLMEGCNYPVLEAMAEGIPVVVSDIPVHRELYSDAALIWPLDDDGTGLSEALGQLHSQAGLWSDLSRLGWNRAMYWGLERQKSGILNVLRELQS